MPGWQITLIAAGAAVLTALLAVAADRAYTARRQSNSINPVKRPQRALTAARPGSKPKID